MFIAFYDVICLIKKSLLMVLHTSLVAYLKTLTLVAITVLNILMLPTGNHLAHFKIPLVYDLRFETDSK